MNYLKDDLSKGFLEAAVAWEVCAPIHLTFAKGKDAFHKTRQADFISHANEAREKHAAIEAHPEQSAQPVGAIQWQPIETAPTDGTSVLVFLEGAVEIGFCWPSKEWVFERGFSGAPTHWMHFPPAIKEPK